MSAIFFNIQSSIDDDDENGESVGIEVVCEFDKSNTLGETFDDDIGFVTRPVAAEVCIDNIISLDREIYGDIAGVGTGDGEVGGITFAEHNCGAVREKFLGADTYDIVINIVTELFKGVGCDTGAVKQSVIIILKIRIFILKVGKIGAYGLELFFGSGEIVLDVGAHYKILISVQGKKSENQNAQNYAENNAALALFLCRGRFIIHRRCIIELGFLKLRGLIYGGCVLDLEFFGRGGDFISGSGFFLLRSAENAELSTVFKLLAALCAIHSLNILSEYYSFFKNFLAFLFKLWYIKNNIIIEFSQYPSRIKNHLLSRRKFDAKFYTLYH